MRPLTDRQERFVHEYLIDQNASAAAARTGYAASTRATQGARLLQEPQVRARIVAELEDLYARLKLDAMEVLRGQLRAAYLDPAKLFDAEQEPIPLDDLDEETRGGLTVTYSRRHSGDHTMHVKQTPRHIAFAVLQKRLDAFAKLRDQTYAQCVEQEEREEQEAREKEQAARLPQPKSFFNITFDLPNGAAPGPAHALGDAVAAPPAESAGAEALAAAIVAAASPQAAPALSIVPAFAEATNFRKNTIIHHHPAAQCSAPKKPRAGFATRPSSPPNRNNQPRYLATKSQFTTFQKDSRYFGRALR